ncbi:MAG: ABC transporter permease [Planctomycetes bacterium]|nr:ABC transporter permease [Planctomycetota bacterium]
MRAEWAIATKDLRLLARDRTGAFFVLLFPLLIMVFFGSVFGGSGPGRGAIAVAVTDLAGTPLARAFASDLRTQGALQATIADDRRTAETLVRTGKAVAAIVIPADFDRKATSLLQGGRVEVELLSDPARGPETALLQGMLTQMGFRTMGRILESPSMGRDMVAQARLMIAASPGMTQDERSRLRTLLDAAEDVVVQRTPSGDGGVVAAPPLVQVRISELAREANVPRNAYAITFPQGVAWGLMGCVVAFGASLAEERRRGTLLRLVTAPLVRLQIPLGKFLGCFMASMVVITVLCVFAMTVLGVRVGSLAMLMAAAIASAYAFSGLAVGLAGFFRTEGSARSAGNAVVLMLAMVGGGTVPLAFMPPFLRTASAASPFSWSIFAIEGAVWRGLGWNEMAPSLLVLWVLGSAGLAAGHLTIRTREG